MGSALAGAGSISAPLHMGEASASFSQRPPLQHLQPLSYQTSAHKPSPARATLLFCQAQPRGQMFDESAEIFNLDIFPPAAEIACCAY